MVTLGVDLASQPKHTAICIICWNSTSAHIDSLSLDVSDSSLLELFRLADKIGIDAPFGWPKRFVRAIYDYSTSMVWPTVDVSPLRYRRTDLVVRETAGVWPLSVSAERIAMTAMRTARLLTKAAENEGAIDRSGRGAFVEAYPAAALRIWGLAWKGYKGPKKEAARAKQVERLAEKTSSWLTLSAEDRSRCVESDDILDALVVALVARASAIGRCEPIPSKDRRLAKEEGWIALPQPDSLEGLV